MAIIRPSLRLFRPESAGQWCEYQVLQRLEHDLPDEFQVFHGIDWSAVHNGAQWFGEFDAIVMAPSGNLVILEVKSGDLELGEDGLRKRYDRGTKNVERQAKQQHASLMSRLRSEGIAGVYVGHLLVFPDARIAQGTVAYPRERIVDASEQEDLWRRVLYAAPSATSNAIDLGRLEHFLLDYFDLVPDPTARISQVDEAVRVLSDGLAQWVPRIRHASGVYRIQATAGSGKTQLALRLLRDAASQHRRARYVCFNRPLADRLARIAPPQVEVATFHELARDCWLRSQGEPDFSDPLIFDRMAAHFIDWIQEQPPCLDLLVLDEAQDLDATWVAALASALHPEGDLYLLGDDDQAFFQREPFDLPEAVTITIQDNFRSPRAIVQSINALGLASSPVRAHGPHDGDVPGWHTYDPDADHGGLTTVARVVSNLIRDGHTPDQIALLSMHGQRHSKLLEQTHLAGFDLRTFTGDYDRAGSAIWNEGQLFADTVMRFKGRAAPVVVLCEMDFDACDEATRRKLFVGFTRAQYRLECVLSAAAERALIEALDCAGGAYEALIRHPVEHPPLA